MAAHSLRRFESATNRNQVTPFSALTDQNEAVCPRNESTQIRVLGEQRSGRSSPGGWANEISRTLVARHVEAGRSLRIIHFHFIINIPPEIRSKFRSKESN